MLTLRSVLSREQLAQTRDDIFETVLRFMEHSCGNNYEDLSKVIVESS